MAHPELHADRGWLAAFRRGERGALERVFRAYVGYVAAIAAGGTQSGGIRAAPLPLDERDDFVHDVFIQAFAEGARDGYDGIRPYAPYLAQIARRSLVDRWRRAHAQKRHAPEVSLDAGELALPDDAPLADTIAIDAELGAGVADFLGALDADARQYVRERFEAGCGQAELASRRGVTRHSIRARDADIRARLRAFLQSWGLSE